MVDTFTNYLDLKDIIFNEIIGDIWLAIFIGLILIVMVSIKAKIPSKSITLLCSLWLMIVFIEFTALTIIWKLLVLLISLIFFWAIADKVR